MSAPRGCTHTLPRAGQARVSISLVRLALRSWIISTAAASTANIPGTPSRTIRSLCSMAILEQVSMRNGSERGDSYRLRCLNHVCVSRLRVYAREICLGHDISPVTPCSILIVGYIVSKKRAFGHIHTPWLTSNIERVLFVTSTPLFFKCFLIKQTSSHIDRDLPCLSRSWTAAIDKGSELPRAECRGADTGQSTERCQRQLQRLLIL